MREELRDYQQDIIKDALHNFKNHKSIMLQIPTGTSKTTVLASLVKTFHLVYCHNLN